MPEFAYEFVPVAAVAAEAAKCKLALVHVAATTFALMVLRQR